MRKLLYFAHPVNVYDTPLEQEIVELLVESFPTWELENPNQPHHQEGYAAWKTALEGDARKSGGMSYYYDVVLPRCHGCVAMSFRDGKMGAGVAGEAKFFIERGLPTHILGPTNVVAPQFLDLVPVSYPQIWQITRNHPALVLSIEETRARTWMSPETYNKVKRPYETAHLIEFDPSKWTTEYIRACLRSRGTRHEPAGF